MTDRINGYGPFTPISVRGSTAPFTPDDIRAAEIEAAREGGRAEAYADAVKVVRSLVPMTMQHAEYTIGWMDGTNAAANRIEAKAKESRP